MLQLAGETGSRLRARRLRPVIGWSCGVVIAACCLIAPWAFAATGETEEGVGHEYVGTKQCRMCHTQQYDSWLASPKAHAWEALQPGVEVEAKARAGLDANTDYRTDPRCLRCHSIGFGRPGGYAVPDPGDDRSQRHAEQREGVGCEACHGPGSGFVKVMKEITREERRYDPAELHAAGRHRVTREVCMSCHNTQAICMVGETATPQNQREAPWAQVDVTDRHGFHEQFPLRYRKTVEATENDR